MNTPVSTAKNNQTAPIIVRDGASGAIVVWQDTRDTATKGVDLYAQRLNSRGVAQWTAAGNTNGIIVTRASKNQVAPAAVSDGRGGVIVVWQDTRNASTDIYAQYISSDSTKVWNSDGIAVCAESHEQKQPIIVSDNLGGAIIVWQDYRNGNADLFAQHIDAGGNLTWTPNGVSVCTAAGDQEKAQIVSDNANGAIVAWQDLRNGADYDIYAQRILSDSTRPWTPDGEMVSGVPYHQRFPVIAADGSGGAFIAWEDYGLGFANIYLQRLSGGGLALFDAGGIRMTSVDADQTLPQLISDGAGGAIAAWQDMRNGIQNLYAQRVDGLGNVRWTDQGSALCTASGTRGNLVLSTDGSNGAIAAWEDSRNGAADIFAQRILVGGSTEWIPDGVGICTDTNAQARPCIIDNAVHGAILAWQDSRNFATQGIDVYAQLINSNGTLGGFSIHGIFFNDFNRNGVQDPGESPLGGWRVNITGPAARSAVTDSTTGLYSIDGLTPGIYTVKQELKAGWMQTSPQDTIVNLSIGGDSIRSFGNFQLGTITGRAFKDRNHNGIADPGDPADTLRLIRLDGAATDSVRASASGQFSFIGLPTGTYHVTEAPKPGWIQTTSPDSFVVVMDTLGHDESGLAFGTFQLARVYGKVYNDSSGDSALTFIVKNKTVYDSTIPNWHLKLYKGGVFVSDAITDGTGAYSFSDLDTGRYVVSESLAVGWIQTYPKVPGDTVVQGQLRAYKIQVDSGNTVAATRDFANFKLGVISGRQYEDLANDSSLAGDPAASAVRWRMKLFKNGECKDSTWSDATGFFSFTGLSVGSYTLEESLATRWRQTVPPLADTLFEDTLYGAGAGPRAYRLSITSGKSRVANFGNFHAGSADGHVYLDVAHDSLILGDPVLAGVRIRLYGRVSARDSNYVFLRDTVSDADGHYAFDNLDFGRYAVAESTTSAVTPTYPRVSMPGVMTKFGHVSYDLRIDSSGKAASGKDFGASTGYITGTIFNDRNGDGIQEFPDSGMTGDTVLLAGARADTAYPDQQGNYAFIGLDVGKYYVYERPRRGWMRTAPPSGPTYTVTITNTVKFVPGVDFGNFEMAKVSGKVYYDFDSSHSRTSNEPGIPGWRVYLRGNVLDSTLTDAKGNYLFVGLPIGMYAVKQKSPSGWVQTFPADSVLLTLGSGESATGIDFGLTGRGSVSGTVFNDMDCKGNRDLPADAGISGWTLHLQGGLRNDSVSSDGSGNFLFPRLSPGDYVLTQTIPAGWVKTSPKTSDRWLLTVGPGGNVTGKDFGDFKLGTVSGTIFNDHNGNGTRDAEDAGLAGFVLYLSGQRADSTVTDAAGGFTFANLDTGKYVIREQLQPYWTRTRPLASDSYPDTIRSSGQVKSGRDFGSLMSCVITGTVFNDANSNGAIDSGDTTMEGWILRLRRLDGRLVGDSAARSAATGIYQFTGLAPGLYVVSEETRQGWFQTAPAAPETLLLSANGQVLGGKNFGNFFFSIGGLLFDDYNGNGLRERGEPGRGNVRLYLERNHVRVDSLLTNADGSYVFSSHGTGVYALARGADPNWIQTALPESTVVDHSSGLSLTGQNVGTFHTVSVSGIVFEDNNRNGVRDPGELGVVQTILSLYRDGGLFARDTSLSDGSYQIDGLLPGHYALYQERKTGYVKSFPVSPDSFQFTAQSGVSLPGRNFGIYLMLSRSITLRSFRDNDGNLATTGDRSVQPWTLSLYRAGVLLKRTSGGGSLDTSNLSDGTYIAVQADSGSTGWLSVGRMRTIHLSSGPDSAAFRPGPVWADTLVVHAGQSHIVDFLNTRPGQAVVQAFSDLDTKFSTTGDRSAQERHLELYSDFVAPGNLVGSIDADSVLTVRGLGPGRYVARQVDSAGWRTIGRIVDHANRPSTADTAAFTLDLGKSDTVSFVNAGEGTLLVQDFIDADGDTATREDRAPFAWNLVLLRDSTALPLPRVDSAYATSLQATLLAGRYAAKQIHNPLWKTIGTYVDSIWAGSPDSLALLLGSGDHRTVDFVNTPLSRTRTWMAGADGQWTNSLNWNPALAPVAGDTVVIRSDRPWRVPTIPRRSVLSSLTVMPFGAAVFPAGDTLLINGDIVNEGLLSVGENESPVMLLNGSWGGHGSFQPGQSTVIISSGTGRWLARCRFHNLQIGNAPRSLPGSRALHAAQELTQQTSGNITVDGVLVLNDDLNAGADTIFILNDDPAAIQGPGAIIGGTIVRSIRPLAGQSYRYQYDSICLRFTGGSVIPPVASIRAYLDTVPTNFGTAWDSLGSAVDTLHNSITLSGMTMLSGEYPLVFGARIGGEWVPIMGRVYVVQSDPDTGFTADLSLRYEEKDLPPGIDEGSLTLLKLRLVYAQVDDTLAAGWNAVSLPVRLNDARLSTIFSGVISEAFRFDANAGAYQLETSLLNGNGYWVKAAEPSPVRYYGLQRARDSMSLPSGWNLIGPISSQVNVSSVRSQPSGNLASRFFGFGAGYTLPTVLRPGRGYWVKLHQAGKLIFDDRIAPSAAKSESGPVPAGLNTIWMRDSRGYEQTLFFGPLAQTDLQAIGRWFELPPPPPEGIFDVRFSDNQQVEWYPAGSEKPYQFRILLRSASYPVLLRWKLVNERAERISLVQQSAGKPVGGPAMSLSAGGELRIDDPETAVIGLLVEAGKRLPEVFALYQCYPNPFNPSTRIDFDLPEPSVVTLKVFDILGREVAAPLNGVSYAEGAQSVVFDGSGFATGVYIYRLEVAGVKAKFQSVRKMILMR